MASITSFSSLLAILFFFFLIFSSSLVSCDDALISQVCSKTSQPVICSECLKSDPASKNANAAGLAVIAANCAEANTNQLYEETNAELHNTKDPSLKEVLEECTWRFLSAKDDFTGVVQNVEAGANDAAKSIVINQILPFVNFCVDQFVQKPKLPLPPRTLVGTGIVKQDCDIVIGILNFIIG